MYRLHLVLLLLLAPALAGCLAPSASIPASSVATAAQMEGDFYANGTLVPWVAVCTIPCVALSLFSYENLRSVAPSHAVERAAFEVAWEPESPWTEELFVSVARGAGDDTEVILTLEGRSPLSGGVDVTLEPGEDLRFWVRSIARPNPQAPTVIVDTVQPFEIRGTFFGPAIAAS